MAIARVVARFGFWTMVVLMMIRIVLVKDANYVNCQGGGQVLVNCYAGTSRQAVIKIILKKL